MKSQQPLSGSHCSSSRGPRQLRRGLQVCNRASKCCCLCPPLAASQLAEGAHKAQLQASVLRVAAVTERCDWPKEAGSRSKAVRCTADCTRTCPGSAPGAQGGGASTAVVDAELLARESPGLVLAQESAHACAADAQHIAEVRARARNCCCHDPPSARLRGTLHDRQAFNASVSMMSMSVGQRHTVLQEVSAVR